MNNKRDKTNFVPANENIRGNGEDAKRKEPEITILPLCSLQTQKALKKLCSRKVK